LARVRSPECANTDTARTGVADPPFPFPIHD
jgi:hypothetical protein